MSAISCNHSSFSIFAEFNSWWPSLAFPISCNNHAIFILSGFMSSSGCLFLIFFAILKAISETQVTWFLNQSRFGKCFVCLCKRFVA